MALHSFVIALVFASDVKLGEVKGQMFHLHMKAVFRSLSQAMSFGWV